MSTPISIDWGETVTGVAYQFRAKAGLLGTPISDDIETNDNVSMADAEVPETARAVDWTATSVATGEDILYKRLFSYEPRDDSAGGATPSPAIECSRIPLCEGIVAGDTTEFSVSGGDYPASEGWDRIYTFVSDEANYSVTGTGDGDDFIMAISGEASAAWKPGVYEFTSLAKKDGERFAVGRGLVTIKDNPESPHVSHARTVRDNLRAVIEGRALVNKDIVSSNINGQEIVRMSPTDLQKWLTFYEVKVKNEGAAKRGSGGYALRNRY